MIKVTVCIGSCCHTKGAGRIVEQLQHMIARKQLKDKIDLAGKFCMGTCQDGVCVTVGEERFSLTPETTETFFNVQILPRVK